MQQYLLLADRDQLHPLGQRGAGGAGDPPGRRGTAAVAYSDIQGGYPGTEQHKTERRPVVRPQPLAWPRRHLGHGG